MCSELHVRGENLWIEQARELAALVGRDNILWLAEVDNDPPVLEPDHFAGDDLVFCLCPIDIDATMSRAGYTVISGWDQPERVDFVAFKEPNP